MNRRHKSNSRADLRLCAATIGTSVIVAMAAIGLMVAQEHDGAAEVKPTAMTVGATSTQTTPSNTPAVAMATPAIKGPVRSKVRRRQVVVSPRPTSVTPRVWGPLSTPLRTVR